MQSSTLFALGPVSLSESVPAAVGVADVPPAPAAASAAANRLDLSRNNVIKRKDATGRLLTGPHRCRCRTCESCGPIYGRKVRSRMIGASDKFRHPALFTLTLKPSQFEDDPERAYLTITQGRYIARLMKHLGVKRYVWVLEFQKSGWPHWHLLIDKPRNFVDLKRAWELWGWNRDGWKLGGIDLGKRKAKDGRHAILYITKYLVKYPDHGFPDWLLDLNRRVRWVHASRAVGRIVSDRERTVPDVEAAADAAEAEREQAEEAAESLPVKHRSLRVRQSTCGQQVNFFREFIDSRTGEVSLRFCGRLDRDLFLAAVEGGAVSLWHEDNGKAWVHDPGNIRAAMSKWIGKAQKRGATAGSTRGWMKAARRQGMAY